MDKSTETQVFFIESSPLTKYCLSRHPYKIGVQQGVQITSKVPQFLDFQAFSDKSTVSAVADEKYFYYCFVSPCFALKHPVFCLFPYCIIICKKFQLIPYFFYGSVRFYLFLCLLNIFHCPTIFSYTPNNAQLHFYSRASYLLRQILLYAGYFICSSCFLIILRTISPPIEPASLDVKSPL